ncbi:hypothetical protein ASS64_09125 [Erythrobacter sp. AP23]|nr:hypothetical protein ASS64_09125 [Erythrobacter sp. AP23]
MRLAKLLDLFDHARLLEELRFDIDRDDLIARQFHRCPGEAQLNHGRREFVDSSETLQPGDAVFGWQDVSCRIAESCEHLEPGQIPRLRPDFRLKVRFQCRFDLGEFFARTGQCFGRFRNRIAVLGKCICLEQAFEIGVAEGLREEAANPGPAVAEQLPRRFEDRRIGAAGEKNATVEPQALQFLDDVDTPDVGHVQIEQNVGRRRHVLQFGKEGAGLGEAVSLKSSPHCEPLEQRNRLRIVV